MASVSGLLSEETKFLDSCLAVRAAEQAYFGGKQVYTNVAPTTSKLHDGGHNYEHGHGHGQTHDHGHRQSRMHGHKHDLEPGHGHEFEHGHRQGHEHGHKYRHEHGHRDGHDHGHRDGHEHGYRDGHEHGHRDGHEHSHENSHGHRHGHKNSRGKELIPKPDLHVVPKCELNVAIQYAKDIIAKALSGENSSHGIIFNEDIQHEMKLLRKENEEIKKELAELREAIEKFTRTQVIPVKEGHITDVGSAKGNSGDEDFDLFGSDAEDVEKTRIVEERLKAYNEKKSKKPGPIAKSSVVLDVKPWDDETDMTEMENLVRGIEMDGLNWGGAKLISIGYGIKKLQIVCVIEDEKVSVDDLIEKITGDFENHVQSVDIVAFNKI